MCIAPLNYGTIYAVYVFSASCSLLPAALCSKTVRLLCHLQLPATPYVTVRCHMGCKPGHRTAYYSGDHPQHQVDVIRTRMMLD